MLKNKKGQSEPFSLAFKLGIGLIIFAILVAIIWNFFPGFSKDIKEKTDAAKSDVDNDKIPLTFDKCPNIGDGFDLEQTLNSPRFGCPVDGQTEEFKELNTIRELCSIKDNDPSKPPTTLYYSYNNEVIVSLQKEKINELCLIDKRGLLYEAYGKGKDGKYVIDPAKLEEITGVDDPEDLLLGDGLDKAYAKVGTNDIAKILVQKSRDCDLITDDIKAKNTWC